MAQKGKQRSRRRSWKGSGKKERSIRTMIMGAKGPVPTNLPSSAFTTEIARSPASPNCAIIRTIDGTAHHIGHSSDHTRTIRFSADEMHALADLLTEKGFGTKAGSEAAA